MKVTIKRGWRHYREGTVLDVPEGAAEQLLRRGIAAPAPRRKKAAQKEEARGPAPGDGPGR